MDRRESIVIVVAGLGLLIVSFLVYLSQSPPNTCGYTCRTLSLGEELNNSNADGLSLSSSYFYAYSASQCNLELAAYCNNNVPDQFVCINSQYVGTYAFLYNQTHASRFEPCPDFVLAGHVGCTLSGNYCVVVDYNSTVRAAR